MGITTEYNGYSINPVYVENKDSTIKALPSFEGDFPQAENEIMVDSSWYHSHSDILCFRGIYEKW